MNSMNHNDMIYLKGERIYMKPYIKEYDVTEHVKELVEELEKMKRQVIDMGLIDYSREPRADIAFIDMKSFYASVECVERGKHPLTTSLCVMSRADNANGLILASSPTFKKVFGKENVGRSYDLPFDIKIRKFHYCGAKHQGRLFIEEIKQAQVTWQNRS